MAHYSAMISYLEKNNFHYFIFSTSYEKLIKAVHCHLPLDTPVERISKSLENFGTNIINVSQMMATQTAPNGQTHMEALPLFLVTLTRNIKPQHLFKINSLKHIV
jgi:hypothetical protein